MFLLKFEVNVNFTKSTQHIDSVILTQWLHNKKWLRWQPNYAYFNRTTFVSHVVPSLDLCLVLSHSVKCVRITYTAIEQWQPVIDIVSMHMYCIDERLSDRYNRFSFLVMRISCEMRSIFVLQMFVPLMIRHTASKTGHEIKSKFTVRL